MTTETGIILGQLDRSLRVPVTLILTPDSAPRLLHRWLAARPEPQARHVLTTEDNTPAHFVAHLAAALRGLIPAVDPVRLSREIDLLDAVTKLLNGMMAIEQHFALVLEEYQIITAPTVHDAITMMATYPPPRMHLYLVSRTRPPLPLARLRVRRQLVEIDLRLT